MFSFKNNFSELSKTFGGGQALWCRSGGAVAACARYLNAAAADAVGRSSSLRRWRSRRRRRQPTRRSSDLIFCLLQRECQRPDPAPCRPACVAKCFIYYFFFVANFFNTMCLTYYWTLLFIPFYSMLYNKIERMRC